MLIQLNPSDIGLLPYKEARDSMQVNLNLFNENKWIHI